MDKKLWQTALAVICILLLAGGAAAYRYYHKRYLPNERRIAVLERELEKVKEARRAWEEALKRGQGQANYKVRFNYLTSLGLKEPEIGPHILKEITPWFETHNLRFEKLEIHPPETDSKMLKRPFTIYGSGRFKDIDATMRWIEEEKRGVISEFRINAFDKKKKSKDREYGPDNLYFAISWHWLEGAPERFHSMVEPAEPTPKLRRNPFRPYRVRTTAVRKTSSPGTRKVVWKPAPPEIRLQGIMTVKDGYKTMINGKYLVLGDVVGGYRIKSIGPSEVILAKENIRCRLTLKTFNRPGNRRNHSGASK